MPEPRRGVVTQLQYAEPVDLYAPVSNGSLTIMRAESAIRTRILWNASRAA
jgi:hypothetical protein